MTDDAVRADGSAEFGGIARGQQVGIEARLVAGTVVSVPKAETGGSGVVRSAHPVLKGRR